MEYKNTTRTITVGDTRVSGGTSSDSYTFSKPTHIIVKVKQASTISEINLQKLNMKLSDDYSDISMGNSVSEIVTTESN